MTAFMVPMELSVLPEDEEGTWRWYNQGDDAGRVRPPPKPNEGAMMDLGQRPSMGYLYHPIAHDDWSCVPAPSPPNYNDGTTSTAPHQWYTNQGDDVGRDVERVRPPPKPNEGQSWGYHSIAQPTTT